MEPVIHSVYPTKNQWRQLEQSVFGGAGAALERVRDYARANYLPPIALLEAAALYTLACTPGSVTLDAGLGPFSPNMFLCLMGAPGMGKDRLMRCARRAVMVYGGGKQLTPKDAGIGSGEGMLKALEATEEEPVAQPVLIGVSEVGLFRQLAGRQGSTLRPHLLNMYSGNALTTNNKADNTFIPADTYRACMWVGAQPDTVGYLLEGDDDGLRHRFIFTELVDPARTPGGEYPQAQPLRVEVPESMLNGEPMQFAPEITHSVRGGQEQKLIFGPAPGSSGHGMQTVLKLAAGIALLRSSNYVTEDDYARAKALMAYSSDVVAAAEVHLFGKRVEADAERMERRDAAEEQRQVAKVAKARRDVLEALRAEDGPVAESPLRNRARRYREEFDTAKRELVLAGAVVVEQTEEGQRVRNWLRRGPNFDAVVSEGEAS